MRVDDPDTALAEEVDNLGVVLAHSHDGLDLFIDEVGYLAVIVAFVFAAEYKHGILSHAFERVPA